MNNQAKFTNDRSEENLILDKFIQVKKKITINFPPKD